MAGTMQGWLRGAGFGTLLLLGGCAGYGPGQLQSGTPVAQVVERMGPPTGEYAGPAGTRRLEFARGPYGRHTFMIDLGADGRVLSWTQVLTEPNFNSLPLGLTQQEVLYRLGRPSEQMSIPRQGLRIWSYRYEAVFCQWFQVSLNPSGQVVEAGYGVDPLCDNNDRDIVLP